MSTTTADPAAAAPVSATAPDAPPALAVEGLGKRVKLPGSELTILDGVDFRIAAGERIAVVGASGSGKSTLLALMAGLDVPTAGRVLLDGAPLSTLDEDGRAKVRGEKVGFVFQSFQLLPSLTALENVMLPLELRGDADPETPARAILDRVGLGERLGHYPRQLSGGAHHRRAPGRAVVAPPARQLAPPPTGQIRGVFLADEPTGNLDTRTGEAIIELLFGLNAEAGTTLVLVTHDARLAERCDRQLRLDSGRLVGA